MSFIIQEPLNGGKMLEGIFQRQKSLITRYQILGMVPPLELDINLKESQAFLRGTVANLIEELVEADEANQRITDKLSVPGSGYLPVLEDYTGELGDVLHFFIELMMYAQISGDDVEAYYKAICQRHNLPLATGEGLTTGMRYARHLNFFETPYTVAIKRNCLRALTETEYEKYYYGGYWVHPEAYCKTGEFNWEITQYLFRGLNFLKKKEWVQSAPAYVNIQSFQVKTMEAFTKFLTLLDFVGMEEKGVYSMYERTNIKNHLRLDTKY